MKAHRVFGVEPHQLGPGEYCFWVDAYYARAPGVEGEPALIANLRAHTVTQNDDGTVTVSPSIEVTDGAGGNRWHGWIRRDRWVEAA